MLALTLKLNSIY